MQYTLESLGDLECIFLFDGLSKSVPTEYIYHSQNVSVTTVVLHQVSHVSQVGLPLVVNVSHMQLSSDVGNFLCHGVQAS